MSDSGQYRCLLIGIDGYPGGTWVPLNGCVNDIDAIQRILIDQAGILPAQIQRLASPLPETEHETTVPTASATLANITIGTGRTRIRSSRAE